MLRKFLGLGLILVLSLSFYTSSVFAADTPSFGPQTFDIHKYYFWGDSTFPKFQREGLTLDVDGSSISFQSVKATLSTDYRLINDRAVTKFVILANGVAVDWVEPYFDTLNSEYQAYYYIDINISTQYIGSDVYFQVIALHEDAATNSGENAYVVGWSTQTATFHFKPLPVTDGVTHGWLERIWIVLKELKDMMAAKLDALTKAVEKIYTPTPAKEQAMDAAMDGMMEKMPMKELADEMTQLTQAMEEAKRNLKTPGARILLSDRVDLIPGEGIWWEIDATEWRDQILLFRTIMAAVLWLSFFYYLQNVLTPKPNI